MTVTECAQRIMTNNWEGIKDVDVRTFGYALEMIEIFKKGGLQPKRNTI